MIFLHDVLHIEFLFKQLQKQILKAKSITWPFFPNDFIHNQKFILHAIGMFGCMKEWNGND